MAMQQQCPSEALPLGGGVKVTDDPGHLQLELRPTPVVPVRAMSRPGEQGVRQGILGRDESGLEGIPREDRVA
eukprot:CAMPEP_0195029634 /NCGR_PEP_ID=MMETSP0326_2-20130528/57104_1 /TAXON_ID=2866 ORGANISM="Crypthecodinium cohnii, Strain Seligo" /NCGR_SAMPLE_ID=MMETSP0326_2 /ASSEMBLY_ACC=CAM_ASM_000348 /LENGTH=72 /DNA_ID=CAMNT_0040052611 /DNA_START=369 /DNA_END=584 /DNA_ORIENTATION=+